MRSCEVVRRFVHARPADGEVAVVRSCVACKARTTD
jgi:hypothetical protein